MDRRVDGSYGWVAVAAAFAAHFVGFGIIYSFTVFFPSILEEFGRGRGTTSWIVSIAAGLMLAAGGVTGRLTDRFGPSRVIGAGATLIGLGMVLSSLATSIWHVYLSYGIVLGLGVACAFVPSVATVGQWFQKRRGLAMGIAVAGTGIGSLVLAPVSSTLIDSYGWRTALRVVGVIAFVTLSLAALVVRARVRGAPGGSARTLTRGNTTFRLLYFSGLVASFAYWIPFVHLVPYATDHGIAKVSAAVIVSVMGIANTIGRVVMGAVADRFGRRRIMQISAFALAGAMAGWPFADSFGSLVVFGVFYGSFAGAFIALLPALAGDYFGMERLASVTGLLFTGAALGTVLGSPVTGMIFDARGSYDLAIALAAIAMVTAALMMLRLPNPSPDPT